MGNYCPGLIADQVHSISNAATMGPLRHPIRFQEHPSPESRESVLLAFL